MNEWMRINEWMNVSKTKLFCIKMFIFVEEFVKYFVPGTQLAIFQGRGGFLE